MGELSLKKKEISRRKDPGWKTANMRNKSSQSRLHHGRCLRAGKPPGRSRVNVFGFKERALSPEAEARSPGWAWRKPRGQSRRRGLKGATD